MFKYLIGTTVAVYINVMIVKNTRKKDHRTHLQQVFDGLNKYYMKLNQNKCVFGVTSDKFPGHMITTRGIEVNPTKIRKVVDMPAPKSKTQIQKLNVMIVALNKFISKPSEPTRPLIQQLKKGSTYKWTNKCQKETDELKTYLQTPPILTRPMPRDILGLYLGISDFAPSNVLFKEQDKVGKPIYYVSRTLPIETRYLPVGKLSLALVYFSQKCRAYFQAHKIQVLTGQPLKQAFKSHYKTTRIAKYAREIDNVHIEYGLKIFTRDQVVADFLVELTINDPMIPTTHVDTVDPNMWTLFVDV